MTSARVLGGPVIEVSAVTHRYRRRGSERVALADVSLTVAAGEMLAIVGESGAGKSTLARLITGLEVPTEGRVLVDGRPPRPTPGRPSPVQMIFQHPTDALNPLMSVGRSVAEPLRKLSRDRRAATVAELARRVGIDPSRLRSRPSAFSGGQLQRLGIARALAVQPRVLVCDEPTSALDVSVQAQIVNLLLDMQEEMGFAGILITHDLAVAKTLADRILVLKDGRAVESAPTVQFFDEPQADYSRALIAAAQEQTVVIEDTEPSRR